jgi:hypothetical protein
LTPDRKEADHANGNSNAEREYIAEEEARVCRNERRDYYTVYSSTLIYAGQREAIEGSMLIRADPGREPPTFIYPEHPRSSGLQI